MKVHPVFLAMKVSCVRFLSLLKKMESNVKEDDRAVEFEHADVNKKITILMRKR